MSCKSPFIVELKDGQKVPVKCGRCPYCKKRKLNDWVFRLKQEDKAAQQSCFVTLTYDTDNVPLVRNGMSLSPMTRKYRIKNISKLWITPKKGMIRKKIRQIRVTQNKTASNDLTIFFKTLRNEGEDFRYYAVGEYGSKTNRPHYHILFFNLMNIDLIFKAWTKGSIHIGNVTGASIGYTVKYLDKPKRVPMYEGDERVPEFCMSSQNLGENFLKNEQINKAFKGNIHKHYLFTEEGYKIAIPDYYRNELLTVQEKKAQRNIIVTKIADNEREARRRYKRKDVDYDRKEALKEIAEYNQYQRNIKKRDKI